MSVSIIIKALNEERHIAAAIESALAALKNEAGGEVILADSGSTDRTREIASAYPIRIALLANPDERSCGVGPQLGFQYATGSFVCVMDGDMVLSPDFLRLGLAFLHDHPDAAGIGGTVRDINLESLEFQRRNKADQADLRPGPVDRLTGGGLYRSAAIRAAGPLSDRNLHAYEEFELGVRLRQAGWTLHRMASPFVDHYGHKIGGYTLLWRRYRSRYVFGIGELLRSAVGRPHFRQTLRDLPEIRLWLGLLAAWIMACVWAVAAPSALVALSTLAILALVPIGAMSLRYRSLELGLYAVVAWNAYALGMVLGFLRARVAADRWIDSRVFDLRPATDPVTRAAVADQDNAGAPRAFTAAMQTGVESPSKPTSSGMLRHV